tara:strand:- start:1006 stop:2391 length:1386 start_codon:yes stop_codon:yes gene_type:complete
MFILLMFFGIVILIYGLEFFNNQITGKVSFELESAYEEGQPLDGVLKIALKEGELIPASSKIVFENAGEIYEYELSEYVSNDLSSGEFYIEGKSILGNGEGYGLEGEKTTYPTVHFTLNILRESVSSGSGSSNITSKPTKNEIQEEVIQEEIQEETLPEQVSEKTLEASEKSQEKKPTFTGKIISNFFSKTFNLFLRITGQVSMKLQNELEGEVSGDKEFIYELEKRQTAKILLGSVKTNSEKLSNDKIDLNIKGNQVIVTTTYSEKEKGFGEDYLGSEAKTLSIDLSKLDFIPKQGDLKINLVYGNEEIVSLNTSLIKEEIFVENEIPEVKKENEEKVDLNKTEINLTNITLVNITESDVSIITITDELTEEEREILINEFGNVSVEITKAEKTSQGIVVRFEIEDFWVEHYYNSEISDAKLREQIEKDKNNFLNDLAKKFTKQEIQKQEVEGLIGNYVI